MPRDCSKSEGKKTEELTPVAANFLNPQNIRERVSMASS